MKRYLEFIKEDINVPFIAIRKAFRELFPTKDDYENWAIENANDIYSSEEGMNIDLSEPFVADSIEQVDESIMGELMYRLIDELGEIAGFSTDYHDGISSEDREELMDKIEKWIEKL